MIFWGEKGLQKEISMQSLPQLFGLLVSHDGLLFTTLFNVAHIGIRPGWV